MRSRWSGQAGKRVGAAWVAWAAIVALGAVEAAAEPAERPAARFDSGGNLVKPEGYREWVFVGAPVTPNDMNGGMAAFPEFHSVYIDPVSWDHYQETGEFRDGTILVKELVSVGSKAATSGAGYFMGEFLGLEAAVKSKAQSPDARGNWSYYSFTKAASSVEAMGGEEEAPLNSHASVTSTGAAKAFPAAACADCHAASAADDMVFTQFYPVLRAARSEHR